MWVGYSFMWISISAAVIFAINKTGDATALWAFVIPLFESIVPSKNKSKKNKSEEEESEKAT